MLATSFPIISMVFLLARNRLWKCTIKRPADYKHKFKNTSGGVADLSHYSFGSNEQMNLHFIEDLNSNWCKIWVYWPWWFWHSGWLGLAWHLSLLRAESEPTVVDASTPALSLSYVLPIVARIYNIIIDIAFKSKLLFHWNFLFYVSK